MARLTKIRKFLEENNIPYTYKEDTFAGNKFGKVNTNFEVEVNLGYRTVKKKWYAAEITSNRGRSCIGVMTPWCSFGQSQQSAIDSLANHMIKNCG